MKEMRILWHISSHGWGHGARQRELIRHLRLTQPGVHITVASDIPRWFWRSSAVDAFVQGSPSPVIIEKNGDIDYGATRRHFLDFTGSIGELLKREAAAQAALKPDLVITDIDPLPVKAAEINRIPAFGISNFTWDRVMGEMFSDLGEQSAPITGMYSHGVYLKLPMGPDHSPFHSTVNVPLLRAGPPGNPEIVKHLLPRGKICLVALRELPCGISFQMPYGFTAVSSLPEPLCTNCMNITPEKLAEDEADFADLLAASDVVVSKPGYGIVSQILAMGKRAVLFTGRKFPDEEFLLPPLVTRSGTAVIESSPDASIACEIERISEMPCSAPIICTGTESVIQILLSCFD
jgi:hypothetical protein